MMSFDWWIPACRQAGISITQKKRTDIRRSIPVFFIYIYEQILRIGGIFSGVLSMLYKTKTSLIK